MDPAFACLDRPYLSKCGAVAELVRRRPKPLWFVPQPILLSAEESARTEQLVNDLLETDLPSATRPESPGVRVLVGTLCTTLLLGAAAATATLSAASPPSDEPGRTASRPEPFSPGVATEAEWSAHHPAAQEAAQEAAQAALVDPAADGERAALAAAGDFYRRLDRAPALAGRRLTPDLPANGRDAPWREVLTVRPLLLRAETTRLVLATVEVAHPDGSRSVLHQRLSLDPAGRPERIGVEVLSLQHFPR
ncbi:hypothetical protein [Saccharopolyspora gloriosae]|uniref:hypothetical protein n=1 Tax=Saccharopolyspora gloriosae TaxID=455344 RepID=UPI001FB75143|nr:hypothetical protein [Saccharopolyspora gloriosae]